MVRAGHKMGSAGRDVFVNFKPKSTTQTTPNAAPRESAMQKTGSAGTDVATTRFQFIDNTSTSASSGNSTQVRRHVMQEFMRQKRLQNKHRQEKPPKSTDPALRRPVPKIKARRRMCQSQSTGSFTASSIGQPATSSLDDWQSRTLTFPFPQDEVCIEGQVEEIGQSGWSSPQTDKGHPDFFFLEPSAFAKLADLSDQSSRTRSVSVCNSFSSMETLMGSESSNLYVSPDPQSPLSAARTDPFDCLPMTLSKTDAELFDFYANVMPACSYGFERRSPHAHNWYLSVFIPEAMKGAVCFQNTILVHAANTLAWVKGLTETALSIVHRARASQILLQHFQDSPTDTSDASISATLSAAALEDFDPRQERREYAWMHFRAAVQKLRDRGGPAALAQHNRLQMLINWSDYIFSGYSSCGPTFYFHHDPTAISSDPCVAHQIAVQEIREQCEEFIKFLRCTEQLAFVQARIQNTPIAIRRQPMRYTAFQAGQPLERLLASPPNLRYTETGRLKQILSRLAALLTINTAIWQYRHSPGMSEEFLFELVENITYNELDVHLSVEALIQILLSGSKNPALLDTERPWFVGRMLKVAKRLSAPSFQKLNDVLLSYLTLGSALEPRVTDWEDELRLEILEAPLTSYVLPLMQSSSPIMRP